MQQIRLDVRIMAVVLGLTMLGACNQDEAGAEICLEENEPLVDNAPAP